MNQYAHDKLALLLFFLIKEIRNPKISREGNQEKFEIGVRLPITANSCKHALPTDFIDSCSIRIQAQPNENRFSDNVIFRNKSPITAVFRIVAVVSHHPVIILFERVGSSDFSVNSDFITAHFQVIIFIIANDHFVKRKCFCIEGYCFSLLRNVNWPVIVTVPVVVCCLWKNTMIATFWLCADISFNFGYDWMVFDPLYGFIR